MDANSDAEDHHHHHHHHQHQQPDAAMAANKNTVVSSPSSAAAHGKPKRQMKTPFQLETLEKAYSLETYPSEATRTKLSQKLGLTDRQLQMWFCHRRLKDRKEDKRDSNGVKKSHGKAPTLLKEEPLKVGGGGSDDHHQLGSDYESECGSGSSRYVEPSRNVGCFDDVPVPRRFYQSSPLSAMKARAIASVEAQLEEPLKEDGPVLGIEFDPLPPDAFGASIALTEQERYSNKMFRRREGKLRKASARHLHEHHHAIQDQATVRADAYGQVIQSPYLDHPPVDTIRGRTSKYVNGDQHFPSAPHPLKPPKSSRVPLLSPQSRTGHLLLSSPDNNDDEDDDLVDEFLQPPEEPFINTKRNEESTSSHMFRDTNVFHDDHNPDIRPGKKRKSDDPRLLRIDEPHENRIHKELDMKETPRRKSEEQRRKKEAAERRDRDRETRKEKERFVHERRQHDEERMFEKEYLMACNLSEC
ncbi:Homeobox-DDT domain protein RLT1 [Linum perenne]